MTTITAEQDLEEIIDSLVARAHIETFRPQKCDDLTCFNNENGLCWEADYLTMQTRGCYGDNTEECWDWYLETPGPEEEAV